MTIQTILEFIVALVAIIIIHELGHFLAARLFKVDVVEFGLGLPPRMLTLFEAGGTKFTLNWLPLGAFVLPKGENDPSVAGGLAAAKPAIRIGVFLAGPLMNILAAVVLYAIIISRLGMPDPTRVLVTSVSENSPAALAGLQAEDIIIQVNDQVIDSTDKLFLTIYANLGQPVTLIYLRGDQRNQVTLTPRIDPPAGEGAIGIGMSNPTIPISPLNAFPAGISATYEHGKALLGIVGQLIQGQVDQQEGRLVGFKGMYDLYSEVRESGPTAGLPAGVTALGFFTNITISLGLLNLLPIPALDGGRILFALPELIFRRRIPPRYENWINAISFTLLILLLLYINLQDFINPVQVPR